MEYIGAILGLFFFIVPVWTYRKGLQDGLNIKKDKPIEPIKNPIQAIQEHKQAKKDQQEVDTFMEGFNNLMSYDGTPQKAGEED